MKQVNEKLRDKLKLISVTEIARLSGISKQNISAWKNGGDVGVLQLNRIAEAFGYYINIDLKLKV